MAMSLDITRLPYSMRITQSLYTSDGLKCRSLSLRLMYRSKPCRDQMLGIWTVSTPSVAPITVTFDGIDLRNGASENAVASLRRLNLAYAMLARGGDLALVEHLPEPGVRVGVELLVPVDHVLERGRGELVLGQEAGEHRLADTGETRVVTGQEFLLPLLGERVAAAA